MFGKGCTSACSEGHTYTWPCECASYDADRAGRDLWAAAGFGLIVVIACILIIARGLEWL